jgi:hypothetical protein
MQQMHHSNAKHVLSRDSRTPERKRIGKRQGPIKVIRILAIVGWLVILFSSAHAQMVSDQTAIESGRQALRGSARFPWYDRDADALREIVPSAHASPMQPSDWQWANRTSRLNWNFGSLWEVVSWIVWMALIGLLVFLVVAALRTLIRRRTDVELRDAISSDDRTEADRIEDLPFPVVGRLGDLLEEARHHYHSGNLSAAIVFLYSYELVQLDKANLIRLAKGKTNRQYVGELKPQPELRRLLTQTMLAFEDVFFGGYKLSPDRFEHCWRELQPFMDLVKNAAVAS